jgi:hypothetical protein
MTTTIKIELQTDLPSFIERYAKQSIASEMRLLPMPLGSCAMNGNWSKVISKIMRKRANLLKQPYRFFQR